MGSPRIWSEQELAAFTVHESEDVRAWAFRRLALHHPDEAGRLAARALVDPSPTVVARALDAIDDHPTPEAKQALAAVAERRDLRPATRDHVSRLLKGEPARERVTEPIGVELERLSRSPDELRERAPALLASASAQDGALALFALDQQPYRWATVLVLERLDDILATDAYSLVWDTLRELGDPSALPAAIAEWRPGERRIASTALRLHRLGGSQEPLPGELVRDAAEQAEAMKAIEERLFRTMDLSGWESEPLRLDLRCTRCSRTYEYDVVTATMHPDPKRARREGWDGIVLGRIIECKRCGAEDAYELSELAQAQLAARLLTARKGSTEDPFEERVSVAELRLSDGTLCKRPSEALRHLRAAAERDPTRGERWRRLGNFNEVYGRTSDAVAAWQRAAEDREEMEACHSLTSYHYRESGDFQAALDYACKTLARIRGPESAASAPIRRAAAETALDVVRAALPHLREPLTLMASWVGEGRREGPVVVCASSVDLRTVRRWDRLVDLFASDVFVGAALTKELPDEPVTQLSRLLEGGAPIGSAPPSRPAVSRKGPCPCGSGKKYKRCCGR